MAEEREFSTPMMKQYTKIKAQYPDAILFFRLGDFYEMFLEDAKIGAKELGITLTARHKGKDGDIPMAGVPYHAADSYISKLIKRGHKVAICEQVGEAGKGKEIVKREVVRVVTPSTHLSDADTDVSTSIETEQYLMNFAVQGGRLGVCLIGMRTGSVWVDETRLPRKAGFLPIFEALNEYAARYQPIEVLLAPEFYDQPEVVTDFHRQQISPFQYESAIRNPRAGISKIQQFYQVENLEGIGLADKPTACLALASALEYLSTTQRSQLKFIKHPQLILPQQYLYLSRQTIRNLELFTSARTGNTEASLFSVLNQTQTAMGARHLREWLLRPLLDPYLIDQRLDAVAHYVKEDETRTLTRDCLAEITDIEKNLSRLSIGIGNARDLVGIRQSLGCIESLIGQINKSTLPQQMTTLIEKVEWSAVKNLAQLLETAIYDEPPVTLTDGKLIKPGYHPPLDELRATAKGGREYLTQLERREQETTGIGSLKLKFNRVTGYYIEVSKSNLGKVPAHYIRRQTLVNAERFVIPELKDHEDQVLQAQAQANQLEYDLYQKITDQVLEAVGVIQAVADLIAHLDVFQSLANVAVEQDYVRPHLDDGEVIDIREGRHPVVEKILRSKFVPNSTRLESQVESSQRYIILTGANMAGKSTLIRQVALVSIMAQIGSFVPAQSAQIGVVDQIHTRIGAADDLAAGLSTFMVEMVETASILNNLTDRSLVILDEVGRGTSTYDGVAIAWAVSEYLLNHARAKVLFATHYLELTQLVESYPEVANWHMGVVVTSDKVSFLYRLKEGASDQSYGIQVAQTAGLPKSVTDRAREILHQLHAQNVANIVPGGKRQRRLF